MTLTVTQTLELKKKMESGASVAGEDAINKNGQMLIGQGRN